MIRKYLCRALLIALQFMSFQSTAMAERRASVGTAPDLTQTIDFERRGEFYLGPTGAKGWIYTASNFMTTDARQILITQVAPGSVAEGVLEIGDVILGADERHFSSDARMAFGRAIDEAERNENRGVLKLIRWRPLKDATHRKGTETKVALKLKVMGTYSDTAPWNCPKTERIFNDALKVIVKRNDMGRFGATALALLATGEKKYIEIVRDYLHNARWARPDIKLSVKSGGKLSWTCGYQNLLLTEYFLATGDKYVLPAIREYAIKTAMGQSNGGTWGHGFAWTSRNGGKLHGSLSGYGALNAAGLPCYLSLLLAKKCGIEHREIDDAIARSSRFFRQFVENGSIGYGYHRPSLEIHASGRNGMSGNGKNGIAAIAFRVEGNPRATHFFSKLTASLYNTCEYGHSGNSYSYFWDPLGANCGGPALAAAFLKELRWYYALTRQADGSFVNQPLGGHYGGKFLDPTAAQILIATLPRRAIYLTGKGQKKNEWLNTDQTDEAIAAGRWRLANTDDMTADELIGKLDDWSPIAREWIAKALAKKKGDFVGKLVRQLEADSPKARAGACAALGHLGERAARAVPSLSEALTDKEPIVFISAGYALARIGKPAQKALPDLLRAVIASTETDVMRPKQQALAYSLGHVRARTAPLYFNGILAQVAQSGNPLGGLDRQLLYPAITKLLHDPSGRTRGCGAFAFQYFSREDTAAMAQQIYDAIDLPSQSFMMFEDAPRNYGLALMARFRIKEGLPLCFETFGFKRWGAFARFPARFKTLQAYRGSAKPFLPQLREMRTLWKSGPHREMLEQTIKVIEEDNDPPALISLHDLVDERLAKDLTSGKSDQQRIALCRALMKKQPNDYFYQAAGLRKMVAILGTGAFADLLTALAHPNEILHDVSVTLAAELPGAGVTDKWVGQLVTARGRQLAGILDVLAHRKDRKALAAVRKYLKHDDPLVRTAALRAVATLDVP
jgi:HEAT repeat protein